MGGNHVFKLLDRGDSWEFASPDLTTQDPKKMITGGSGAETHCTVVALTESPVKAGTLWAGTDDGKLWVTTDAGAHWSDLTANLKGVPAGLYVSGIEASHHDATTAYVAIDGHRSNDFSSVSARDARSGQELELARRRAARRRAGDGGARGR